MLVTIGRLRTVFCLFTAICLASIPSSIEAQAAAQTPARWSGFYAGADISTAFGMPDFTFDSDANPGHSGGFSQAPVKPGVSVGGRVGVNKQIGRAFVLGGE